MAAFLFSLVILWAFVTLFTGSFKAFPIILLILCLIFATVNGMRILVWPFKNSITEELSEVIRLNTKKNNVNKQYKKNMIRDKRFGQNNEKYLRLKAFAF